MTRRRTSAPSRHWYRCLVEGCPAYGRIIAVAPALDPGEEGDRHYMSQHFVPGAPPVADRQRKENPGA